MVRPTEQDSGEVDFGVTTLPTTSPTTLPMTLVRREIAYGMDALIPGVYFWLGRWGLRLGGCPVEEGYPGMIHSWARIGVVLPGYRIWTTDQGGYDPERVEGWEDYKLGLAMEAGTKTPLLDRSAALRFLNGDDAN